MAKYVRYRGEFLSRAGIVWRVEILQENANAFPSIGALTFEATEPLVLEWKRTDKEETICGSTATIRLESPGDRTYEDLYSIEVGQIRLDVYRAGYLYWSGALDPEFYEEPYEKARNYPVSLTFSDFGILGRLKYNLAGMQTLQAIVTDALTRSTINYGGLNQSLISTKLTPNGNAMSLADLRVRSDNFYDEDGEAATLEDAITGILQPLGLRMVQRGGNVFIYDLNGLYNAPNNRRKAIVWDGASSTMGTDKVANNVKITWNTYAQGGNQGPEDCWTETVDSNLKNLNNTSPAVSGNCEYFSYHYSGSLYDWLFVDAQGAGFTLWLSANGKNATINNASAKFYKIVEQYDGSESEGIAILWTAYKGGGERDFWSSSQWMSSVKYGIRMENLYGNLNGCGGKIFTSEKVYLPPVDNANALMVRVTLSLLMDCRFNPFESASNLMTNYKQKEYEKNWNNYGNFVYVPVTLKYQPDGSNTVYCWTNRNVVGSGSNIVTLEATYGTWQVYNPNNDEAPTVWGYLVYYDGEDRKDKSGVIGWKKNRPGINPHRDTLTTVLAKAEEGQYVPYPNSARGGKMWLEVRAGGWMVQNDNNALPTSGTSNPKDLWSTQKLAHILMQLPQFEIMNRQQFDAAINTDDVEYEAEINIAAKEGIEIDTICGTHKDGIPTARGAYFKVSGGQQVKELTRAGRTTQAEELLIGTLYSQFAQRRTTLSGEVEIPSPNGLSIFTEQNQGDKVFMIAGDVQDVIKDTTETDFVELRPDEYDKAD